MEKHTERSKRYRHLEKIGYIIDQIDSSDKATSMKTCSNVTMITRK